MIDPRKFASNDKRFPDTINAGDAGKVIAVNATEDAYEFVSSLGAPLTGTIIMWPSDAPPGGYLMCDGLAIDVGYVDLIALVGSHTPVINFAKNSVGVNTRLEEVGSVGTHGHDAVAIAGHSHGVTVNSNGNHSHLIQVNADSSIPSGGGKIMQADNVGSVASPSTNSGGDHIHSASAASAGGHTPTIQEHSGITQPACTLLNFCIKT